MAQQTGYKLVLLDKKGKFRDFRGPIVSYVDVVIHTSGINLSVKPVKLCRDDLEIRGSCDQGRQAREFTKIGDTLRKA